MKSARVALLLLYLPLVSLGAQTTNTPTIPGTTPSAATPTAPAASTSQSGTVKPDLSVPVDKKDKWVVGFCSFNAERLPADDQYLTYSVPLLLKNQLAGISTHVLSASERELIRKAAVTRELDAVDMAITGFFKERDALLFETPAPITTAAAAVDAKVAAAAARRDFLKSLDLNRITVADRKPLEIKAGTGVGNLLDAPQIPVSVLCARQGIDLLVGGMIREVEGYVLVDVWAYDAASGSNAFTYRDAALREEVYQSVPAAGRGLTGVFLGRPWSSISFAPDPPESSLFVDGKQVATGRTPTLYLAPGSRDVRVSAPGYKDLTETVTLEADQETSLAVTLEKEKTGTIVISSTPPGADVYVQSVWMGKTPLSLEKPFQRTRVDISEKGFYDQLFSVSEASPPELSFVMQPDTISRDELQKQARNEFYDSFAWFALSLPIPLFCYAFAIDASVQVKQLEAASDFTGAQAASLRGGLLYGGYVISTAWSATLFTWMLFRIIHYVTLSTRSAG